MSTAQRVSRSFHRFGVFLGAITLLVVGMVLFDPTQASRANPIAQTGPVEVRPEAPYAWAVKGTQYALELKGEREKGTEDYKYQSEPPHNFDSPNLPNNGIAAKAKQDLDVLPGHDDEHHSMHPLCTQWEERFEIVKGVTEKRCVEKALTGLLAPFLAAILAQPASVGDFSITEVTENEIHFTNKPEKINEGENRIEINGNIDRVSGHASIYIWRLPHWHSVTTSPASARTRSFRNAGFKVIDANGQSLAYVLRSRRSA